MVAEVDTGDSVLGVMRRIGKQIFQQRAAVHGAAGQRLEGVPSFGMRAHIHVLRSASDRDLQSDKQ